MRYSVGEQKKELIIEEAKKLIWDNGITSTSVNEIAKAAQIRQSLVYYYFKDKNEIAQHIYNLSCIEMENTFHAEVERRGESYNELMYRGLFVAANMRANLTCPQLADLMTNVNTGAIQLKSRFVRSCYRRFVRECPDGPSAVSLDLVMIENIGLNSLLIQMHRDGDLLYTTDTLLRYKLNTLYKSIRISEEETKDYISKIMKVEPFYTFHLSRGFQISIGEK